ncbi:outer membrane protein assembly factor BamB family protein [Nocardioides pantholopis]|uniref:outer membrane protein assembly factor BamB family protein n=1 Tax=Nocardioides pantholopis TaxID=2483798 RepID=UPI0013DE5113|nr:PQQ-binding-like beta-propeller repeat protein [Nocardioides pantholopis]
MAALILVGGGVGGFLLLRDDDAGSSAGGGEKSDGGGTDEAGDEAGDESGEEGGDGSQLRAAPESEPSEQWTWSSEAEPRSVLVLDALTVVGTEDEAVVALDEEGEELWRAEGVGGYPAGHPGDRDDLLVVSRYAVEDVEALTTVISVEDGTEVWSRPGAVPWDIGASDGLLLHDEKSSSFVQVDAGTGEERWSTEGDYVQPDEESLYLLREGELAKLDRENGTELWSADAPIVGPELYPTMAITEAMVVIGLQDATAYDVETGEELWEAPGGADGVQLGRFDSERIYLGPVDYAVEPESVPQLEVRGADGEAQELVIDEPDPFFYGLVVEVDGEERFLSMTSGQLLDADLAEVDRFEDPLGIADGGVYTGAVDELSFHRWGEEEPEWTAAVEGMDPERTTGTGSLRFVDGGFVVIGRDRDVTLYR